jgi:Mg-chelatase subunit ChlD
VGSQKGRPAAALLVLLTDGRANVARSAEDVWRDVERVCAAVCAAGVAAVVIDTGDPFVAREEAGSIARWLNGRRLVLPQADAAGITRTVNAEIRRLRDL